MVKTAEQISRWLGSQSWFEQFKTNLTRQNWYDESRIRGILDGLFGEATIAAAFEWEYAKEGTDYWIERQDEFLDWFLTQTLF